MNEAFHLLESELRFRSLFENNPDAVVFQNKAGVILDANPSALALLNQPRDGVINRHINDFLPPDKQALFHEKLVEAFRGIKVQFETDVQFRGQSQRC